MNARLNPPAYELHPLCVLFPRMDQPTAIYVVKFSDDRIKVGITGNVRKRMSYYTQEAQRNRVSHLTWWACKPFHCKRDALKAERVLCRVLADAAIPRHREWFNGTSKDYSDVVRWGDELRATLGSETGVDRLDIPHSGSFGHWQAMAQA